MVGGFLGDCFDGVDIDRALGRVERGSAMSVMVCNGCDGYIDTDFVCEGIWENKAPYRYWCPSCLERKIETKDPDDACLAAFREQEPDDYAAMMEQ